jgi:cytochrome b561
MPPASSPSSATSSACSRDGRVPAAGAAMQNDAMQKRVAPAQGARYGGVAQAFHWITAILVLVAFLYGPGGSEQRVYSAARDFDRQLHETLGLSVLILSALRLAWRAFDRHPDPEPVPLWMGFAAKAVQVLLYILLFVVPLTAISGAWLEGHPLTWLGGEIGPWLPTSHDLGKTIAEVHGWLGDVILWVAGLHAVAALYHHFVLKDGVLRSMLPGR